MVMKLMDDVEKGMARITVVKITVIFETILLITLTKKRKI